MVVYHFIVISASSVSPQLGVVIHVFAAFEASLHPITLDILVVLQNLSMKRHSLICCVQSADSNFLRMTEKGQTINLKNFFAHS